MKNKFIITVFSTLFSLFLFLTPSWAEIVEVRILGESDNSEKMTVFNFSKDGKLPPLIVIAQSDNSSGSIPKNPTEIQKIFKKNTSNKVSPMKINVPEQIEAYVHVNEKIINPTEAISLVKIGDYFAGLIPQSLCASMNPNDVIHVSVKNISSGNIRIGTKGTLSVFEDLLNETDYLKVELSDEDEAMKMSGTDLKDIPIMVLGQVPVGDPNNNNIYVPLDIEKFSLTKISDTTLRGQLEKGKGVPGLNDPLYQWLNENLHISDIYLLVQETKSHLDNPEYEVGTEIINFYSSILNHFLEEPISPEDIVSDLLAKIAELLTNDDYPTDFDVLFDLLVGYLEDYVNPILVGYQWGFFKEYTGYQEYNPDQDEGLNITLFIEDLIKDVLHNVDLNTQAYGDLQQFLRIKFDKQLASLETATSPENVSSIALARTALQVLYGIAETLPPQTLHSKFSELFSCDEDPTKFPGLCNYLVNADTTQEIEEVKTEFLNFLDVVLVLLEDAVTFQDIVHNFLTQFNYGAGPLFTTEKVINFLLKIGVITEPPNDPAKFVDTLVKTLRVIEESEPWGDGKINVGPDNYLFGLYQDPDDPKDISVIFKEYVEGVTKAELERP